MVTAEAVRGLEVQLVTANKLGDAQACIDVLIRLETEVESTNAFLKETKIGVVVNGVAREACSPDVADLAKALVMKWKQALGLDPSAAARRSSVSKPSPVPPPIMSPPSFSPASTQALAGSSTLSSQPEASSTPIWPPLTPIPRRKTSHDLARPILVTRISKKRAATTSPEPLEPPKKLTKVVRRQPSSEPSGDEDKVVAPAPKKEPVRSHRNDEVSFDKVFGRRSQLGDKVVTARKASLKALYDALACDSTAANETILAKVVEIEQAAWDAFPPGDEDDEGLPTTAYRAKLRMLLTVKAPRYLDYRERILSGELDVDALIAMKPNDFITDEQKALDERARLASLQSAQISASDVAEDLREKARWRPG